MTGGIFYHKLIILLYSNIICAKMHEVNRIISLPILRFRFESKENIDNLRTQYEIYILKMIISYIKLMYHE
jgi:hypothetical protein